MTDETFFPATAMPDHGWWAALWPDPEGVIRSLGVKPSMTVLDLCCGDGYFTAPLAKLVGGRVYALDIDQDMIELARMEVERSEATVKKWICADARDLAEHVSEEVDYVLIANTFHGVPDKTGMAKAVASILKSGGHFSVVNWHPLPREQTTVLGEPRGPKTNMRMSPDDVRLMVEPAGFVLDQVIELAPYHYGAIFQMVETA